VRHHRDTQQRAKGLNLIRSSERHNTNRKNTPEMVRADRLKKIRAATLVWSCLGDLLWQKRTRWKQGGGSGATSARSSQTASMPHRPTNLWLQRLQESDQVFLLLARKVKVETLIIEVDCIHQVRSHPVMEVRSSCRQSAQHWSLEFS